MCMSWEYNQYKDHLAHHGIKGQKWGVKNGPPYPLDDSESKLLRIDENTRKKVKVSLVQQTPSSISKFIAKFIPSVHENMKNNKNLDITVDGKKVGDAEIFRESNDSLNVVWVGVDNSQRGKGYATAAMNGIIKYAKKQNFKQVTLEVPGNSPDARHIYEKLGFKVTGTVLDDDPVWDGLTAMTLQLQK